MRGFQLSLMAIWSCGSRWPSIFTAQKYDGPMHCVSPEVLGLAAQWSFWAMLEMEELLLDLMHHRAVLPEVARDASHAERDERHGSGW
jgi:glutathione S-transferase